MSNICIAILIGIPGAGKTHFCKYLMDNLRLDKIKITNISYDECEQSAEVTKYKNFRNNILKNVNSILQNITENNSKDNEIIIVDDNMYYRSMRHSYYNLAKKFRVGFCQIFVSCDVSVAIERNNSRTVGCISVDTIKNMFEKLEPPLRNNSWEKYFCEISSDKMFVKQDVEVVRNVIEEAMKFPVQSEQQITGIPLQPQGFIHKVDLILRKQVGYKIKNAINEGKSKQSIQLLSEELRNKKKSVLDGLRNNELFLPEFGSRYELENNLIAFLDEDDETFANKDSCENTEKNSSNELTSDRCINYNNIDTILRILIARKIKDAILAHDSQLTVELLSQELLLRKKIIIEDIRSNEFILPEYEDRTELESILNGLLNDQNLEPSVKRARYSS